MTQYHFVWTDLSTYDMDQARHDYSALFHWTFSGDPHYDFAVDGVHPMAAIFPMPDALAKIDMPSFWMSYVRVPDLEASLTQAQTHPNVILEIPPTDFGDGRIALLRDPSGAGFTLYEGPDITPKGSTGQVITRTHHLPDIELIKDFYTDLFGWSFEQITTTPWPKYTVNYLDGTQVALVEEVPENIRGKFRYWMPCFAVPNLATAQNHLGTDPVDLGDGRHILQDSQGAHFIAQDISPQTSTNETPIAPKPWRAVLGLLCIWAAVLLEVKTFWGVLFLIWTWPALTSGKTEFIDPLTRRNTPLTYWALIATWIGLSSWMIASTFR